MGNLRIGLIGATGKVGISTLSILSKNSHYNIRCGYRTSMPTLSQTNIEWKFVDIFNQELLYSFCNGCYIILNCAGPVHHIGDIIACMAERVGAIYIDSYGTTELKHSIIEKGLEKKGAYVLGGGTYPGLTGIVLKYALESFDKIESCCGMTGSCEPIGRGAAEDLLYSNALGFGIASASLKDGEITIGNKSRYVYIPQIESKKKICPYLPEEILSLAKYKKIKNIEWYNILPNDEYLRTLATAYQKITNGKDIEKELDDLMKENLRNEANWNLISIIVKGKINNKEQRLHIQLFNESAYELTGIVIALITLDVLKNKLEMGMFWAFEIINWGNIVYRLKKMKIDISIQMVEDNDELEHEDNQEVETGII